jgi:hypothetical protein
MRTITEDELRDLPGNENPFSASSSLQRADHDLPGPRGASRDIEHDVELSLEDAFRVSRGASP